MVLEKRKERRLKANLPIKITYQNNLEIFSKTENLSRLGTYVETEKEIPAGSDIDISLEIPTYSEDISLKGPIVCKGNVFRCDLSRETESKKYYGIGIFFTDFLRQADRDKLSQYIDLLILNEDKKVGEGIKHWQEKRDMARMIKQPRKKKKRKEELQPQALNLLKQILAHVEEISRLLKSPSKN